MDLSTFNPGKIKFAFDSAMGRYPLDHEMLALRERCKTLDEGYQAIELWRKIDAAMRARAEELAPLLRSFGASTGRKWTRFYVLTTLARLGPQPGFWWRVTFSTGVVDDGDYFVFDVHWGFAARPGTNPVGVLPVWTLRGVADLIAQREGAPLTEEESAILDLCALAPL